MSEYSKSYYQKNRDRLRAAAKRRYAQKRDAERARKRDYYRRNREARQEYQRHYYTWQRVQETLPATNPDDTTGWLVNRDPALAAGDYYRGTLADWLQALEPCLQRLHATHAPNTTYSSWATAALRSALRQATPEDLHRLEPLPPAD